MRQITSEAILLDAVDLHERDRIVAFLTPEHGTKRGVARGARGKYSRFAGLLQPLARVSVQWFERDDRDLVRINELSIVRSGDALQQRLDRLLVSSYLAEHAAILAPENEASPRLFRLLEACVDALINGADEQIVARYFEVWGLKLAGVFPDAAGCGNCAGELRGGPARLIDDVLCCSRCAGEGVGRGERLGAEAVELLIDILRRSPSAVLATAPSAAAAIQLELLTATLRRQFLGDELRSYKVMKQALSAVGPA